MNEQTLLDLIDGFYRAAVELDYGPGRACQMPRLTEDRSRQMPCGECLPCMCRKVYELVNHEE